MERILRRCRSLHDSGPGEQILPGIIDVVVYTYSFDTIGVEAVMTEEVGHCSGR
jgi:hypothetical protein